MEYSRSKSTFYEPYETLQRSPEFYHSQLGKVLKMAGNDAKLHKAHSCRSASTSKAKVLGISLKDILKRGHEYKGEF